MLMGRALALFATQGCGYATLWTEERNRRPRAVYEAAGWRPDGAARKRDFLGYPIRELRYCIELDACLAAPDRLPAGAPHRSLDLSSWRPRGT